MKKLYLLLIVHLIIIFFIGCQEAEDQNITSNTYNAETNDEPVLIISHESNLDFSINAYNFPDLDYIQFQIYFDASKVEFSSATISEQFFQLADSVSVNFVSAFSSIQSGDFLLGNISFTGSSYDNVNLVIKNLYTRNGNVEVEGIQGFGICYIDKGILIHVASSSPGPLSGNWEPTGDYTWSNGYCNVD